MSFAITDECTGCTACVRRCPTEAITGERNELHVIDPDKCVDCGACGVVCADEAIVDRDNIIQPYLKKKQWPKAQVDELACVGCDKCSDVCPFDCLWHVTHPTSEAFYELIHVDLAKCTGCRLCEWACPYDAIFIFRPDEVPKWIVDNRVRDIY